VIEGFSLGLGLVVRCKDGREVVSKNAGEIECTLMVHCKNVCGL
jgi:hypothetical protein